MKCLFASVLLLLQLSGFSQYVQHFNTLVSSGTGTFTQLPDGWGIYEVGSGSNADGRYAVGTGSSNTGNAYSFGAAASTERALGTVASGTNFPTMGAIFFNERDSIITAITITYTGEQWRYGGRTTGTRDTLRFEYSLDAQGIVNNVGTWVRIKPLDFLSLVTTPATTSGTALDGNASANRQTITYTITGLTIQPGGSIVVRWSDFDISGNDDGLAIDDFSISAGLIPGVMNSGGTNTGGGTGGSGGSVSNSSTSTPVFQHKVATDSSFLHLYGNLHGHSTHSDGKASTLQPQDDYNYARTAAGMDFLGISEHNHSTAGLNIANYKTGAAQADAVNGQPNAAGQPFIALHGMEWGTISGGGHVLVYGFKDSLINWEAGNYDIYVAKSDYMSLFDKVRNQPGAIALLAHPGSSDFTGLTGGYKGVADSAVSGMAIESGPAFSTSTSYGDYPSSLAYISYYQSLLKQGYRVGAHMDQDNHEMTFGSANGNRMVVLSRDRTRESLLRSIAAMRVYASNDYNATLNFSIDNYIMGSSILHHQDLAGTVSYADADGELVSAIQLYGGRVGGSDAALIQSGTAATLNFTTSQAIGETWYYYAVITQMDGNKLVSSPIWVTKLAYPLPVTVVHFKGALSPNGNVQLNWNTAAEENADHFVIERSQDLRHFQEVGQMPAKGDNSSYSLVDHTPSLGMNYYRLRQVDKSGAVTYSNIIRVNRKKANFVTVAPNPAKGLVRITTNGISGRNVQVQFIDVAGNMVYNKSHAGGLITLDVSSLPNGFYLVRVGDELTQLVLSK